MGSSDLICSTQCPCFVKRLAIVGDSLPIPIDGSYIGPHVAIKRKFGRVVMTKYMHQMHQVVKAFTYALSKPTIILSQCLYAAHTFHFFFLFCNNLKASLMALPNDKSARSFFFTFSLSQAICWLLFSLCFSFLLCFSLLQRPKRMRMGWLWVHGGHDCW